MNFDTAVTFSERLSGAFPGLMVAGFKRITFEVHSDHWSVDVFDPETGRLVTVDELDGWDRRLRSAFPRHASA